MTYKTFTPKHFASSLDQMAKELLPPDVYLRWGTRALRVFNYELLVFIDDLRGNLGVPLVVNSKRYGFEQRGLRTEDHYDSPEDYFDSLSTHKYGMAIDFHSPKMSNHEIRKHIIENKHLYPHISFMEVGINWVHCDVRTRLGEDAPQIVYWHPKRGFITEGAVLRDEL